MATPPTASAFNKVQNYKIVLNEMFVEFSCAHHGDAPIHLVYTEISLGRLATKRVQCGVCSVKDVAICNKTASEGPPAPRLDFLL